MKILAYISLLMFGCQWSNAVQEEVHHGSHHVQTDKHHFDEKGDHNSHFDHEAMLGSKQLEEEFDNLAPEEAKRRLGLMYKKIDTDSDGLVSEDELTSWIVESFKKLDGEDSMEELEKQDKDEDGKVSWKEYISEVYGYNAEDLEGFDQLEDDDLEDFNKVVSDDHEKFKIADINQDGFLDTEEYKAFTHPYDYEHMHESELRRTYKDYDKDGDGFISKKEFVAKEGEADRETEIYEEEQFASYDKDGDDKLDKDEILEWVLPSNLEVAREEALHLFGLADLDKDKVLTKEEMLDKHEEFVGSIASNYLPKDEL